MSNTQDNKELKYERHEIKNSPFTIVEEPKNEKEAQFHLTVGRYRFETYTTYEEAEKEAFNITWDKILQVVGMLIEAHKELTK